jgi:hypothetical protein
VADAADRCPKERETINGVKDDDGCPDRGGKVLASLQGNRVVLAAAVAFDGTRVRSKSQDALDQAASHMKTRADVGKWKVAVVAPKADEAQGRADSIKAYLVKRGVPADAIEATGGTEGAAGVAIVATQGLDGKPDRGCARRGARHRDRAPAVRTCQRRTGLARSRIIEYLSRTMKLIPLLTMVGVLALALRAGAETNPLLQPWKGPYGGVPPWDKVKLELFKPAFVEAIAMEKAEIAKIAENKAKPTFENTLAAMQRSGRALDRLGTLWGVWTENLSSPEVQALDREVSPMLAAAADEIVFNQKLFERIAAVNQGAEKLAPDQKRLTQRTYDAFVRRGAKLDGTQKARLSAINQELATAFSDFGTKVLADETAG